MAINVVDIMLAKRRAQGQAATIPSQAQQALQTASSNKDTISDLLESATEDAGAIHALLESDAVVRADITQELTDAEKLKARQNIGAITAADITFPDETTVTITNNDTTAVKSHTITVEKGSNTSTITLDKNYTSTGNNVDGSMTQKAITDALQTIENQITSTNNNNSSNTSINFGNAEPGTIVIVGEHGTIEAGSITQDDIIRTQLAVGTFNLTNDVGIEVNYETKTVSRLQSNNNFNNYKPFGGRKRCNVADNGAITAFEGDNNYIEDGSNGQVMVYQPKFYYLKKPTKTTLTANGEKIDAETIAISSKPQAGFVIHPLFLDANGTEIDYVLLSAYEGCAYDTSTNNYNTTDTQDVDFVSDKLSSIANAKPISGTTQALTMTTAEQLANNRGTGWKLTNLAFESVNQLLMTVEYGTFNLQAGFLKGCTELDSYNNQNASCLTGSTSSLGSTSGRAPMSTRTKGGTNYTYSEDGKCSISYRGLENPYGNMWRFVGGVTINGTGSTSTVTYTDNSGVTHDFATKLSNNSNWISAFGYDSQATWANIPIEASATATSALPIGDYIYVTVNLNGTNVCLAGGSGLAGQNAGPYYYDCAQRLNSSSYYYSGRLMYIPTANSTVYNSNIALWNNKVGSDFND